MFPIHYAHSQNIDELFGIKLFDNATNYVSSEFIENNKYKNKETKAGFWGLNITTKVSSPYFDIFFITIDDFNVIHQISGERDYFSEDRCLDFLTKLVKRNENRKQVKFKLYENDLGKFRFKKYYVYENNFNLNIMCGHKYDPIADFMATYLRSDEMNNAINEYYDQD